jgi:hypothetical protein
MRVFRNSPECSQSELFTNLVTDRRCMNRCKEIVRVMCLNRLDALYWTSAVCVRVCEPLKSHRSVAGPRPRRWYIRVQIRLYNRPADAATLQWFGPWTACNVATVLDHGPHACNVATVLDHAWTACNVATVLDHGPHATLQLFGPWMPQRCNGLGCNVVRPS